MSAKLHFCLPDFRSTAMIIIAYEKSGYSPLAKNTGRPISRNCYFGYSTFSIGYRGSARGGVVTGGTDQSTVSRSIIVFSRVLSNKGSN